MIRWATGGLVVLLAVPVGFAQTADVIQGSLPDVQLRANPFGGAPVAVPVAAQKPLPPGAPPSDVSQPGGGRPIRPAFTLPGPAKLDRHGDPLPAGAVARYGTVRLRHGPDVQGMAFTHDGKLLCTVSGTDDSIRLWDATTGKEVARLNSPAQLVGLTKDGAIVIDDTRVRVWLHATNSVRDLPEKTLPEEAIPTALAVNPDGRSFAVATNGKVLIIDAQNGKTLRELNLPGNAAVNPNPKAPPPPMPPNPPPGGPVTPPPQKLLYSPDGRFLVGNGQKTGVWLWDLRTGKRVRTYRTEADFPEYSFSPDVTKIAVTGERVHLYSLDSEEAVEGFNKGPEGGGFFSPRFAPDGKTLYLVDSTGGLLPLDASSGEEKEALDAPEMNLRPPFALSAGADRVAAIDQSGGIRIWDPKTGKGPEVSRLPPLNDIGVAAGGKTATVVDQTNKVHTFDLATGAPGKVIELPSDENGLPAAWDPASRRAAVTTVGGEELEVQFIDADTLKVLSKHSFPQNGGIPFVSFASANRDRAAIFGQNTVSVVNPTTGKSVRSFNPGQTDNGTRGAISPDGRLVALATRPLSVWEVATGKRRLTIDAAQNADRFLFSDDSRHLVAVDQAGNVVVVDLRTGTTTRRFQTPENDEGATAIALSGDGKRLAVGMPSGRVTVFDVATGDTLAPFTGHEGVVNGLAFTADGKKLVSSAQDGTALVWDVPDKPQPAGPAEAAVTGFDEAFRLLGSADPAQAQRGMDYLYRHPADTVKQTGDRLPAPAVTPAAKLTQLLADLDSDDFQTREAAVKALEKVGGEATALLKQAAEKSANPEVRKLASELLGKIEAPASRAEDLRLLRAVEVMENLGTPEARAQLERWAAGPAGHRTTLEAAAALARLKAGGK